MRSFLPVGIVLGIALSFAVLDSCNVYQLPFSFNNPNDPNRSTTTEVLFKTITVDGDPSDWGDMLPMMIDPQGDEGAANTVVGSFDIQACFVARDATFLYWRIDLWNGAPDSVSTYNMRISQWTESQNDNIYASLHDVYVNENLNHIDSSGTWLYSEPIAGGDVVRGSTVEGKIRLSSFTGFQNAHLGVDTSYEDSATGTVFRDKTYEVALAW